MHVASEEERKTRHISVNQVRDLWKLLRCSIPRLFIETKIDAEGLGHLLARAREFQDDVVRLIMGYSSCSYHDEYINNLFHDEIALLDINFPPS